MYMTNLTLRLYFWGYKHFINIFEKLIKNCYPKTTFIFLISCLNQGEKKEGAQGGYYPPSALPPPVARACGGGMSMLFIVTRAP